MKNSTLERMRPWLSAAAGVISGYLLLALAVLWLTNLCLPVSAHELKWQCEVSFWVVGAAYFFCSFVAAFFTRRWQATVAFIAFTVLFVGHALLPHLAIISFGKRWYLAVYVLLFAVLPAIIGAVAAILARRLALA